MSIEKIPISITISTNLLEQADKFCKDMNLSRSGLVGYLFELMLGIAESPPLTWQSQILERIEPAIAKISGEIKTS